MKKLSHLALIGACLTSLAGVKVATARIVGVLGGPGTASPALGPYTMTPFPRDVRPERAVITQVLSPLGGEVDFSHALRLRDGLMSPYHGVIYAAGDTGATPQQDAQVTLELPPNTY